MSKRLYRTSTSASRIRHIKSPRPLSSASSPTDPSSASPSSCSNASLPCVSSLDQAPNSGHACPRMSNCTPRSTSLCMSERTTSGHHPRLRVALSVSYRWIPHLPLNLASSMVSDASSSVGETRRYTRVSWLRASWRCSRATGRHGHPQTISCV